MNSSLARAAAKLLKDSTSVVVIGILELSPTDLDRGNVSFHVVQQHLAKEQYQGALLQFAIVLCRMEISTHLRGFSGGDAPSEEEMDACLARVRALWMADRPEGKEATP